MKARLRKWYKRRKRKGQSESFRKVMRYVEPKKFYEDNLFSLKVMRLIGGGYAGFLKK